MTRQEKKEIVAKLVEKFRSTDYFYIINAEGLDLEKVNKFRDRCFQAGIGYQVVKNTLIHRALGQLKGDVDYRDFSAQVLKGFSGILFPANAANTPARLIKEFRNQESTDAPVFKGACIDSDFFVGEAHLEVLSKLKSKEELVGEVIGLLQAPISRVVTSLQSGKHHLAGVVQALAEKNQ